MQASVKVYRGGFTCPGHLALEGGSNAARQLEKSDPVEFNKIGNIKCVFVIRAIGGHSDAFPYIDMSRICRLATLESLLQIPGVFHMTRLTCILSICRTGIQAGYAKSRNHSFFGTFCISDKRNLVGGRGKSSANDSDFAGCCLSVKPEAFFKKGPWFTGSGMLLLEPDKVVMLEDIEQITMGFRRPQLSCTTLRGSARALSPSTLDVQSECPLMCVQ